MVNQTDSLDSSWVNLGTEENQEIAKDRRYSGDSGCAVETQRMLKKKKMSKLSAKLHNR